MRDIEFNNGFITALGLFYGHREQWRELRRKERKEFRDQRIYGASDHLYDIEYPEGLDDEVKEKVSAFTDFVFSKRLEDTSWEEGDRIFEDCRNLLALIDKKVFGLDVVIQYG